MAGTSRRRSPLIVATALLLLPVQLGAAGRQADRRGPAGDEETVPVEVWTVGLDPAAGAPIVLLRDPESGRVLPIWIGAFEAQAIARALHDVAAPRPMTHDLMATLLSESGARVEEVVVRELRSATYFATVRVRVAEGEPVRDVDSRPSDALALALRTGARVRAARRVLAEAPGFDFVAPDGQGYVAQIRGITLVPVTRTMRQQLRLPDRDGALVASVFGRAQERGLRRGDLVVAVGGRNVRDPLEAFDAIRATPSGAAVRITYWRDGEEHEIDVPGALPPGKARHQGRGGEPGTRALAVDSIRPHGVG